VTSKKKSEKSIHLFLVDTNLFIASVKNPKKETTSLKLLLELIEDATIELIGNEFLIMEMEKYAQVFQSERGKEILQKLIDKTKVMDVNEKFLRTCKSYFPEDELIDEYFEKGGHSRIRMVENMYCTNCGKEIDKNARFCGYCGYELIGKKEETITFDEKERKADKNPKKNNFSNWFIINAFRNKVHMYVVPDFL